MAREFSASTANAVLDARFDAIESSLDASLASGGIYPDAATGLAAVAAGEYFSVPSTDDAEYLILYRDVAGVATEIKRYPSASAADRVVWRAVANFDHFLANDSGAAVAGNVIFFDALPASDKIKVTIRGKASGTVTLKHWSRVVNTFTLVADLGTITVAAGVDKSIVLDGPFDGTTHFGFLNGTGEVAFVNGTLGGKIVGGGLGNLSGAVSTGSPGVEYTTNSPQINIEIPADIDDALNQPLERERAVVFAGREDYMSTRDTGWGARQFTFATPSPDTGRLILDVFGGTVSGWITVSIATQPSAGQFTRKGNGRDLYVEAWRLNKLDTGLVIEEGEYVSIFHYTSTIARASNGITAKGAYYHGNLLQQTTAGTDVIMVKAAVIPEVAAEPPAKALFLGDSIVQNGGFQEAMREFTGLGYVNGGIGGTRLARTGFTADYEELSVSALAEAIGAADFTAATAAAATVGGLVPGIVAAIAAIDFSALTHIIVMAGTNDFVSDVVIGSPVSAVRSTVRGGVQAIVEEINATHPHIQIVFATPIYRSRQYPGDGLDSDTVANGLGDFLRDHADAIKEEAGLAHCRVVDLFRESGINRHNAADYIADGVHIDQTSDLVLTRIGKLLGHVVTDA